jgi:hypothetical protein
MTIEPTDIVEQGRSAWERLRSRQRATWDEWLAVGRAIIIGRTEALKSANTNRASARRRPSVVLARSKPDPAPPGIWLVAPRAIPTHTAGDYLAAIVSSHFQVDDRIALNLYNHSGV